jgi:predicted  nucleic acid-binding Zn-ribbon protein
LLAATSLARAIDPNASVTLQRESQQAAFQAQNMAERITRMEDEIERINAELISLRERKIEPQQPLQAQEDFQ